VKVKRYFKGDDVAIEAYITAQVKNKFPLSLFDWSQVKMGNIILSCIEEQKALQQQQQQPIQPQQQTTSFAPEPPPAPDNVQPTAQAGQKQSFSSDVLQVTPVAQSVPDAMLAQNEVIQTFSSTSSVEFTAPINDMRTTNAETPQEATKIQNDAAEQQRVPERAARTTGGVNTNVANNVPKSTPFPEENLTVLIENMDKRQRIAKQQLVMEEQTIKNKQLAVAIAGVTTIGILYTLQ
jgi:hypothetical protein